MSSNRDNKNEKVVGSTPSPSQHPLYPTLEDEEEQQQTGQKSTKDYHKKRYQSLESTNNDGEDDNQHLLNTTDENNNNNTNNEEVEEEPEDDPNRFESGIVLQNIIRDPSTYKPKLQNSQDEIQSGDALSTKFIKTVRKQGNKLEQKFLDSNKKIDEKFKESNKKVKGALTDGFDQVIGGVSKPFDILSDYHHKRLKQHEKHETKVWITDYEKISKYECLDYVTIYNKSYRDEMYKKFNRLGSNYEIQRWIVSIFMGIFIGFIAYLAHIGTSNILYYKFEFVIGLINDVDLFLGFLAYFTCNTVLATFASLLAVYYEPTAAGSGIPEVKGYLNGTKIPHTLKFKTLWTKLGSMILAVSSNLQVGAEGPMIHIGAIVGNGFSQAQSKEFGFKVPFLRAFRNDKDKRDFVTSGAGAGVAAAFGAPLGGALFSQEEVSSFWSTTLTWRSFLSCLVATFSMKLLQATGLTATGLMIFNMGVGDQEYAYYQLELIPFMIIGVLGGLAGAAFTAINVAVVKMRREKINKIKSMRVLEVFAISAISTILQFFLPLLFPCRSLSSIIKDGVPVPEEVEGLKQFNCEEGYFNELASIIFASNEEAIVNLLSINNTTFTNTNRIGMVALLLFFLFYFFFAAYTAGCGISSGTFVPMIVIGAAYGRAVGVLVRLMVSNTYSIDPGTYAVMGAAAFMAGVSRLTISLTVILIETTNELQYLIPIMVTIMVAKWTADLFIHPLFDVLIEQKYIPYLEPHPSKAMRILMAKHIMARKPHYCCENEKLGHILDLLKKTKHNGFPVVNNNEERCVKGLILRSQLLMIVEKESDVYISTVKHNYDHQEYTTNLTWKLPDINDFSFDPADLDRVIPLSNIMNLTVLTVNEEFAVSEAFQLFRTMGLRHMPVVNEKNRLKGIITKKDLLEKTCEQKYKDIVNAHLEEEQITRLGDEDLDTSKELRRSMANVSGAGSGVHHR